LSVLLGRAKRHDRFLAVDCDVASPIFREKRLWQKPAGEVVFEDKSMATPRKVKETERT
jgi:hypothetical protein